jgi:hypothetical protein
VAQCAEDWTQHAQLPGNHGERQCFGQVNIMKRFMRIFIFQAVNDLGYATYYRVLLLPHILSFTTNQKWRIVTNIFLKGDLPLAAS